MSNLPKVNINHLKQMVNEGGMDLLYHMLRREESAYMFEDFNSVLVYQEVKKGNTSEQHLAIEKIIFNENGF
jgi:hypothetical protein